MKFTETQTNVCQIHKENTDTHSGIEQKPSNYQLCELNFHIYLRKNEDALSFIVYLCILIT